MLSASLAATKIYVFVPDLLDLSLGSRSQEPEISIISPDKHQDKKINLSALGIQHNVKNGEVGNKPFIKSETDEIGNQPLTNPDKLPK